MTVHMKVCSKNGVYTEGTSRRATRRATGPPSTYRRARRWAWVSPGSETNRCRSSGLSTSTAIPANFNTTQGLPGCLRGGVVRFEAVVAEAEREKICRAAEGGVGAASVAAGTSTLPSAGACFRISSKFPRLNEGDIGGDHQCALDAAFDADASSHLDGAGLAGIVGIGNDFEPIVGGEFHCVRIACYDRNRRAILPGVQRCEHIVQHGLRQRCAGRLIEDGSQTLLGR